MKDYSDRYIFGEWIDINSPLTKADAQKIIQTARENFFIFRDYSLEKVFDVLEKVRKAWLNPTYKYRREITELLKETWNYSEEMIQLSINELLLILDEEALRRKMHSELKGLSVSNYGTYDFYTHTLTKWEPLGVLLHIISGNVFLVGISSMITAWITGNVSVIKMPSSETTFLPIFLKSVIENDADGILSRSLSLIEYSSNNKELIDEFKDNVDGIVIWGGEDAVRAYRENIKAKTKLIIFGPKISLSVITEKALNLKKDIAKNLAADISIWDQNACTSPQVAFVEKWENCVSFAKSLSEELSKVSQTAGKADINVAVEIQKLRSVYEMKEARNEALIYASDKDINWTVIADKNNVIEPSPLHRTIRIVPFKNINEVVTRLLEWKGYIQTIGLAADERELEDYSTNLLKAGALRIMMLGHMAEAEIDDPHDGSYELPQFGNFVYLRNHTKHSHPMDYISEEARLKLINNDLIRLLRIAKKSPFYKDRIPDEPINTIYDLEKVPILTRADMERNMPPLGDGLKAKESFGGYVSRSGGTTGEPKYSIYDKEDWNNLVEHAVKVFIALGVEPYDKVANLLLAGNLYGSFVSFDHVNVKLGITNFAFTASADPELFIKVYKNFGINVIEGIPSFIMKLMREAKEIYPELNIKKIIYGGAPMSLADKKWLKENIGAERISSVIGANDGGQFAFQCECLQEGSIHHTCDDFNYIEIVDDSGKNVANGEKGKILITSLKKFSFPLIRYEIGDIGRIVKERCECGRTNRLIEYLGRHDSIIVVGTINLNYEDVFNALQFFNFSDLQLVVKNSETGGEKIVLKIEGNIENVESIKETVFKKVPKLLESIKNGSIEDIQVELYKPNSLLRNKVSGKLKKILDERFFKKQS